MSEISTRIRKLVDDPTVSEIYGAWGILQPIQRNQIRQLCDTCDAFEKALDIEHGRAEEAIREQLPSYAQVCSEDEAIQIGKEYGKKELLNEIVSRLPTDRTFHNSDIQMGYAWAITAVMKLLSEIERGEAPDETM